ncbi:hypothetical protein [Terrabacter aerolatus]|uniref:hypothetical protein n=1 Tax=Terrabacter aerolatus TaxID=422442 RepID=UPI0011BEF85E|nr:hypothetical protein [Terrabacter aerolatus]
MSDDGGSGSGSSDTAGAVSSAPSSSAPRTRVGSGGSDAGAPSYGPSFPLVLRRTGGIAGFDDRIVLDLDGRMHVETRSVHGRVCTLPAPQQRQLVALLATVRLDSPADGTSPSDVPSGDLATVGPDPVTDPITISVTDEQARPIDLSDPSLGEISALVGGLVGDVTLTTPATTRCTTPVASAPPAAPAVPAAG